MSPLGLRSLERVEINSLGSLTCSRISRAMIASNFSLSDSGEMMCTRCIVPVFNQRTNLLIRGDMAFRNFDIV